MAPEHGFFHIYIGPAGLCPCPPTDESFLIISGDTTQKSKATFEKRSRAKERKKGHFQLSKGVIGQSGNEKNWYVFAENHLNGIFPEKLIAWCNPAINTSMEASYKVRAEKLDTYIEASNLGKTKNAPYKLILAEGDPLLILKRSKELIRCCGAIDFSLHPLALIWLEMIDELLSEFNFHRKSDNTLLWLADNYSDDSINACKKPSSSEEFLDFSLQALLRNISLKKIRVQNKITSKQCNELQLLKSLVVDKLVVKNEPSISGLIRQRTSKNLSKIFKFYKKNSHQKASQALKYSTNNTENDQNKASDKTLEKAKLKGNIDGIRENLTLHGWVDATAFGAGQSKVKIYWEEKDELISEALVNVERLDLLAAGIETSSCGFCAKLSIFERLPIKEMLDTAITLKLIESKSGLTIGGESWFLSNGQKEILLNHIFHQELYISRKEELLDYLATSKNQYFLANIRAQLIKIASISFQAGDYDLIKFNKVFEQKNSNAYLDYGSLCESATRLELIFSSIISLISIIDQDKVLQYEEISGFKNTQIADIEWLNSQLQERIFLGLQAFENKAWITSLQPLIFILMSTMLLQNNFSPSRSVEDLIQTIASLTEGTYNNPKLAFQLLSIIEAKNKIITHSSYSNLAQRMGDNFTYLVASFGAPSNGMCRKVAHARPNVFSSASNTKKPARAAISSIKWLRSAPEQ